jgi:hypothetical protein
MPKQRSSSLIITTLLVFRHLSSLSPVLLDVDCNSITCPAPFIDFTDHDFPPFGQLGGVATVDTNPSVNNCSTWRVWCDNSTHYLTINLVWTYYILDLSNATLRCLGGRPCVPVHSLDPNIASSANCLPIYMLYCIGMKAVGDGLVWDKFVKCVILYFELRIIFHSELSFI